MTPVERTQEQQQVELVERLDRDHIVTRWMEHGIPVFDEYDRSSEWREGCPICKSRYGPCDVRQLLDALPTLLATAKAEQAEADAKIADGYGDPSPDDVDEAHSADYAFGHANGAARVAEAIGNDIRAAVLRGEATK